MCAIFGILDLKTDSVLLHRKALQCSHLMRHRGPDSSGFYINKKIILMHERLSIIDINNGAQPLYNENRTHVLIANGEIYNYKDIRKQLKNHYIFNTNSDCEVILALYQEKGFEFLDELQGMFAFILYDITKDIYLVGRDHIGIIPLYTGYDIHKNFYVASEMKALIPVCQVVEEFPPGRYLSNYSKKLVVYYKRDWFEYKNVKNNITNKMQLKSALEESVQSHLMSDVPYGVLLSGGLDSSIISSLTKKFFDEKIGISLNTNTEKKQLHSFSVGLDQSSDLYEARKIAKFLGTIHHEIIFTIQEGLDAIKDVIFYTETYDITTIRASTPMYLMSKKIQQMGIKMVLSGEGSDEIFGGYLYFHKAPNKKEFHQELVRKLNTLHMYDCVRVNKATSAFGIEARVPFLDKNFLDIAMRINPQDKMCGNGKIEKHILRECFSSYLPDSVIWRQKEQFSDGVGYSWIDSLKKEAMLNITDNQLSDAHIRFPYNTPFSKEGYLYREIFEKFFPLQSAAKCVNKGYSIACSSEHAIKWDESFKEKIDPSGRSVNVHKSILSNCKIL